MKVGFVQKSFLVFLVLVWLTACSVVPQKEKQPPLLFSDHVLVDKIWDVRAQKFISQQQLLEKAVTDESLGSFKKVRIRCSPATNKAWGIINPISSL